MVLARSGSGVPRNRRRRRVQETPTVDALPEGDLQPIQDGVSGARLAGPRGVHVVVNGHLDRAAVLQNPRVIEGLTTASRRGDTQLPTLGSDQVPRDTGDPTVTSPMVASASGHSKRCGRERNEAALQVRTIRSAGQSITPHDPRAFRASALIEKEKRAGYAELSVRQLLRLDQSSRWPRYAPIIGPGCDDESSPS